MCSVLIMVYTVTSHTALVTQLPLTFCHYHAGPINTHYFIFQATITASDSYWCKATRLPDSINQNSKYITKVLLVMTIMIIMMILFSLVVVSVVVMREILFV